MFLMMTADGVCHSDDALMGLGIRTWLWLLCVFSLLLLLVCWSEYFEHFFHWVLGYQRLWVWPAFVWLLCSKMGRQWGLSLQKKNLWSVNRVRDFWEGTLCVFAAWTKRVWTVICCIVCTNAPCCYLNALFMACQTICVSSCVFCFILNFLSDFFISGFQITLQFFCLVFFLNGFHIKFSSTFFVVDFFSDSY